MNTSSETGGKGAWLTKIWRVARWVLLAIFVLYIALAVYRFPVVAQKQKSDAVVAKIHAQKLTREVVLGDLPNEPDKEINDATVAGVDANRNGIRDDVERAIYFNHKDSAKVVAAEYQYAMAIQMMLTQVFDTNTWIAAAEETSRGDACVGDATGDDFQIYLKRTREVENMMVNTSTRHASEDAAYMFTASFTLPNTDICNVDLNTLPN
ncbi:MAG: hypothetical protein JWO43_347 [Candidatus Adlerbacteria bacterium]|nr:hypothetical protein [Candidatus Adlerbacteria bacterium]